jgi:hypothetical protein
VPAWLSGWSDLEKELAEAFSRASWAKNEDTTNEAAEQVYLHLVEDIMPRAAVATQAL